MRIGINAMLLSRCESGVENTIAGLLRALASRTDTTHRYTVYLPAHPAVPVAVAADWQAVYVHTPVLRRLCRIVWEQLLLPRRLATDGVDVLLAPAYLAPLRARVPVVLTVHDLIALDHPQWCTRANVANYRLLLPPSIRKATRILVPSQSTRRDLAARFPACADKCRVVHFGVDPALTPTRDDEARARVRQRYGLPESYILFLGRHEPKKNLPHLVRAFEELRRTTRQSPALVLAGARGWGETELDRVIARSPCRDVIVRPGFIEPADLPALYGGASLFVFPSLYEGFGIPPLEAMACDIPVIVSASGALPENVGDAALCVDPLDGHALALAMNRLLTDGVLRATLQGNGRERVRAFAWHRTADETVAACAEAVRVAGARS